jgi:hypothetical protein
MSKTILLKCCLILSTGCILCGCSLSDSDDEACQDLVVTIEASQQVVSPSEYVTLTVTAQNRGPSRVVWGYGSSSCQLGAAVRIAGIDLPTHGVRACADDIAEHGLGPGESRQETWAWNGAVSGKQGPGYLAPGNYEVRGAAGAFLSRNPVNIEVVRP